MTAGELRKALEVVPDSASVKVLIEGPGQSVPYEGQNLERINIWLGSTPEVQIFIVEP